MTPAQEAVNALSMFAPLAWCYACRVAEWAPHGPGDGAVYTWNFWLVLLGTCVHLPFSFGYHVRVALGGAGVMWPLSCSVDNPYRRLDSSAIHLCCALYAIALSGGAPRYSAAAALFNAYAVALQWQAKVVPRRNQRNLAVGVLAYLFPLLLRGDWPNACFACACAGPGFYVFLTYPFGGYSHAVFHLTLAGLLQALLASAQHAHSALVAPGWLER